MTKLKKVLLSAAVGAAMAGAGFSASAADPVFYTDLGAVQIDTPKSFSGVLGAIGGFVYEFTFTVPANGGSGYNVERLAFELPPLGNIDLLFTTVTLFSDTDGDSTNGGRSMLVGPVLATGGGLDPISFTAPGSTAGFRILQVAGTTNGSLGGAFIGSIEVSPVPEPETWAMMLIGAGLVGFQLRRRAKQSATQRLV